jgi:alcohol dehydrogenase
VNTNDHFGPIEARPRDPDRLTVYELPTRIVLGVGSIRRLGEELASLNIHRPLLVTDQGLRNAGVVDQVLRALEPHGLTPDIFDEVESDPTTATVEAIRDILVHGDHDGVIALGGGSPMDAGKAAAALTTNEGELLDLTGPDNVLTPPLPVVAVPTTAGTGSEVTRFAVLSDKDSGAKVSIASMQIMPRVAILDPELTYSVPPKITAPTGVDALAHAVESYGSVWTHPIAEGLALHAVELVGKNLRAAVHEGDHRARSAMLAASCIAELAANSTRLGLAHALAVPLGATHKVPHGVAVALTLPHMCRFNESADPSRYERLRDALDPQATTMSSAVEALNRDVGITEGLRTWGVEEDDFDRVLGLALRSDNVQANPRAADYQELSGVLAAAL